MNNDNAKFKTPSQFSNYESHNRRVTTKMGQVEKILPKSVCRLLDTCGFCSLLNLDYKTQLSEKIANIKEKLLQISSSFAQIPIQNFFESNEKVAYRQSVKLVVSEHFVNGKPWIDIGFYRQSLNKIVDIGNCPIQNSTLNDITHYLRGALKTFKIPIYSPRKKTGLLSGLILRSSQSTGQTFVIFLTRESKPALFRELSCDLIEKLAHVRGVFLQVENFESQAKITAPVLLTGYNTIEEKFDILNFKLTNEVECPIHPQMSSKIFSRVVDLCDLNKHQNIIQLYSGAGVLSCLLAQKSRTVYAFDEKEAYVRNTEINLKLHKIQNVQIQMGKISQTLAELTKHLSVCDKAVVTAPKGGIQKNIVEQLCQYSPKTIVYISSFNNEMFEDLKYFKEQNYTPLFIEPFDTHPGTPYCEVLCFLTRRV